MSHPKVVYTVTIDPYTELELYQVNASQQVLPCDSTAYIVNAETQEPVDWATTYGWESAYPKAVHLYYGTRSECEAHVARIQAFLGTTQYTHQLSARAVLPATNVLTHWIERLLKEAEARTDAAQRCHPNKGGTA